jgi:hypothetical protein
MQILDNAQHRALAYVSAANRGGYRPTTEELHEWLTASRPRGRIFNSQIEEIASALKSTWEAVFANSTITTDPETFAGYLVRLGWVENEHNSLGLTPLGRALLRTAEADEDDNDSPTTVVLGAQDKLAYPMLIRRLAEAGLGLLVDPYLERLRLGPPSLWARQLVPAAS